MPSLVVPSVELRPSFLAAMAEFRDEGRGRCDDVSTVGHELRTNAWGDDGAGFAAYVARLRADVLDEAPRPAGYVPCTTLWWADGDQYLGRVAIRHRLNDWLRDVGGHIGYDVRPSCRRQGHGAAMLAAALPVAADLGIDPALITCDVTNVASRKLIEKAGGELEDDRGGKLRFWVSTRPGRHAVRASAMSL